MRGMTDNLQEEWLQDLAASIKLPSLSPSVCRTLFAVIEANLRQLIQKAWKYTRRSHSRTMKVEDFNLALLANKDQPIYGLTNPHADRQQNKDNLGPGYVNLIDFANTPLPPIPLKPQIHLHWLAVNGEQPMIAENPSISSKAAMGDDEFKTMSLPKEMQVGHILLVFFSVCLYSSPPPHTTSNSTNASRVFLSLQTILKHSMQCLKYSGRMQGCKSSSHTSVASSTSKSRPIQSD